MIQKRVRYSLLKLIKTNSLSMRLICLKFRISGMLFILDFIATMEDWKDKKQKKKSRRSRHSRSSAIYLEGNPADFSLILWRQHGGVRVYFSHGWRYLKNPPRNFFSLKEGEEEDVLKVPLGAVKTAPKWASVKSSGERKGPRAYSYVRSIVNKSGIITVEL